MNNFKRDTKKMDFYTKNSKKCRCGHTVFLGSRDKIICSWCKKYVFESKRTEFAYRIGELLKNEMLDKKNK